MRSSIKSLSDLASHRQSGKRGFSPSHGGISFSVRNGHLDPGATVLFPDTCHFLGVLHTTPAFIPKSPSLFAGWSLWVKTQAAFRVLPEDEAVPASSPAYRRLLFVLLFCLLSAIQENKGQGRLERQMATGNRGEKSTFKPPSISLNKVRFQPMKEGLQHCRKDHLYWCCIYLEVGIKPSSLNIQSVTLLPLYHVYKARVKDTFLQLDMQVWLEDHMKILYVEQFREFCLFVILQQCQGRAQVKRGNIRGGGEKECLPSPFNKTSTCVGRGALAWLAWLDVEHGLDWEPREAHFVCSLPGHPYWNTMLLRIICISHWLPVCAQK